VWRTSGQNEAIELFENELKTGSLSHAYLLIGPRHIGKTTLSYDLALAANCVASDVPCLECNSCQRILKGLHTDIFYISIDNSLTGSHEQKTRIEIGIDDIKKVQQYAGLPPYEGKYKIFIVDGADQMSNEAANCLLKTLEEPPLNIILMLLATDESKILPTIASRCQKINLKPMPVKKIEEILIEKYSLDTEQAKVVARLSSGRLGWAINCLDNDTELQTRLEIMNGMDSLIASNIGKRFSYIAGQENGRKTIDRKKVESLINNWLTWWRDLLLVKNNCADNIVNVDCLPVLEKWSRMLNLAEIKNFIEILQDSLLLVAKNANIRLLLEVILLDMPSPTKNK
jgi:DNA polymerase-3 subunit delta'